MATFEVGQSVCLKTGVVFSKLGKTQMMPHGRVGIVRNVVSCDEGETIEAVEVAFTEEALTSVLAGNLCGKSLDAFPVCFSVEATGENRALEIRRLKPI